MKIKVVVFDLYNTLIETGHSENFFRDIYKRSETGFGITFSAYSDYLLKNKLEEVIKILPKEFEDLLRKYETELLQQIDSVKLYPESIEVLNSLSSKYELYLISNLASPYKAPFFKFGLANYFKDCIFSCDTGFIKPDRKIFKIVEQRSGCSGNSILMVGDSKKSDIKGSRRMKWESLRIDRKKKNLSKGEIGNLEEIKDYINSV